MIRASCECGAITSVPEANVNQNVSCAKCARKLHVVSAESLPEGAGEGDFDSRLKVVSGPAGAGDQIFLGGVADIEIGKLAGKHILLPGTKVSRNHCKLVRVDFGPSRWR